MSVAGTVEPRVIDLLRARGYDVGHCEFDWHRLSPFSVTRRSAASCPGGRVARQTVLDGTRCTWIERACVALLPGSPDPAKDRRVDDAPAERLDKRHVKRGEPGHGLHIDRPVRAISEGSLCEHGRQEGVHGRVPNLCQRLSLKNVQYTERAVQ